jgi:hypothetical protein
LFDQNCAPEKPIYPDDGDNLVGTPKPSKLLPSPVIPVAVSAVAFASELNLPQNYRASIAPLERLTGKLALFVCRFVDWPGNIRSRDRADISSVAIAPGWARYAGRVFPAAGACHNT